MASSAWEVTSSNTQVRLWRAQSRFLLHLLFGSLFATAVGDLHYLTVRGSGHMVPEYKADVTLAFVEAFVQGKEFPRYVGPSGKRSRHPI